MVSFRTLVQTAGNWRLGERDRIDSAETSGLLIMRLSKFQLQTIRESALNNFGDTAEIWLFGSRVCDDEQGGDIDLYIEAQEQPDLMTCKLKFLRDLHRRLGDQKIDVVLRKANSSVELPIDRIAKQTGIRL